MSDVFASLAAGTSRSAGGAAATAGETAIRVIDPSPELTRLASGENLRGTVVGKDERGHLLVRTQLGVLQLAAIRNLPVGTEVVLQVRNVGPQVMMNLLPLETAAGSSGQAGPAAPTAIPPGQAAPALPPNPHDLVQRGEIIRGVLHAAPPIPLLAGLPTAQPGAELLVRILSLGVHSQGAGASTSGTTPAGVPAAGVPAGGATAGGTTSGAAASGQIPASGTAPSGPSQVGSAGTPAGPGVGTPRALPAGALPAAGSGAGAPAVQAESQAAEATPGTRIAGTPSNTAANAAPGLRLAPQMPVANSGHSAATALQSVSSEAAARAAGAQPGPAAAKPGSGGAAPSPAGPSSAEGALRVTGLVTAVTSSGQPILHTPLGTVTLDTRASLPLGSSLALQITLPATQHAPAAQALAAAWPSLEGLEETLFQGLTAPQMEAVSRALPQVGPRLASGVLFFLSALSQGNVLGWLAPAAAAAAERGEHGELYDRLGREFAGLNRSIETPAGEWRFINLPLWSEQGLRELRCFFRHQDHGDGTAKDGDRATRFVLELHLERHGDLQLDGLVRAKRFDLVLRSRQPLPALVRGDLMALFEEANAIAGYTGQLTFRASRDWLQMLSARAGAAPHEGLRV